MFSFIVISAVYWVFMLAWFALVQKPMFGIYNHRLSARHITARDVAAVYSHGFVSDAIVASYLTALPLVVGFLSTLFPAVPFNAVMTVVNILAAIAVGLLVTADTVLYSFWKYKIDVSVFAYLRSLKGATASVSTLYLITAITVWWLISATCFAAMWGACHIGQLLTPMPPVHPVWWGYITVTVALAVAVGLLFFVIRGTGIRPHNPSVAYFNGNQFLNHWALNPGYNMIYSLTTRNEFAGRFRFMDQQECDGMIKAMFPTSGKPATRLLKTDRPNIIFVVWESLGADMTGVLGGRTQITPNLDSLAASGVLLANCTGGSFRTDRALVCLLSGYPAQPTTSIIRYTRKLPALPGLARTLAAQGYHTAAIHGGDLSIMHKSDYYLASGHDRLISHKDFPSGAEACKWGVHDVPLMDRVADEALRLTHEGSEPWFLTVQTLSSHEPFEVPDRTLDDPVENAFAYTDRALGRLIDRLKDTPVWDNLLIMVSADHGLNLPRPVDDRRAHSHIPVVMGGGAVAAPAVIDTMMSQTDLAATLLGQMGIAHDDFLFSRDILSPEYTDRFGLHIFNQGIMLREPDGYTVLDTMLDEVTEGTPDPVRLRRIRAILQKIYQDLDKR